MTSWPLLQTDLRNAGAEWVDDEVVVDQGPVTSRRPDDIPSYNREMIRPFSTAHQNSRVLSVWRSAHSLDLGAHAIPGARKEPLGFGQRNPNR
jgi:DJ-1/PfpI family